MKTNILFHTQKGIGKNLVRSWVRFGNWGSVPLPLSGARISETDQPTRCVLISICSLSSSALTQRYPGYGLHSLFFRSFSSASLPLLLLFVLRRRRRVLLLPLSFFSLSPSLPQFRRPQKIFSTKARILVLHFRSSSFQIRCLSFHSDDGTTFVYISSPSCVWACFFFFSPPFFQFAFFWISSSGVRQDGSSWLRWSETIDTTTEFRRGREEVEEGRRRRRGRRRSLGGWWHRVLVTTIWRSCIDGIRSLFDKRCSQSIGDWIICFFQE